MKVSVALCTYNGEKFLEEQFNSYLTQTLQPQEIVICDDGSTDKTIEIAETLRKKTNIPVRIYRNDSQLGFVKNFEKAISLCTGDLIALSDQDDVWMPDKLEILVSEFKRDENRNLKLIFTDLDLVNENLEPLGKTMWGAMGFDEKLRQTCLDKGFLYVLKKTSYVTGASVMIRKELVKDATPFEDKAELWFHDGQLAVLAAKQKAIKFIERPLVLYRQNNTQSIGTKYLNLPSQLSLILNHNLKKKKSDMIFFEKAGVWDRGEKGNLEREIKHIEQRIDILKKSFFRRIIPVGIELIKLNYWKFYRWRFLKVALSDFLND